MSAEYYLDIDGGTAGPFTIEDLTKLREDGIIHDGTLWAKHQSVEWLPIAALGLPVNCSVSPPPPPPLPPPILPKDETPAAAPVRLSGSKAGRASLIAAASEAFFPGSSSSAKSLRSYLRRAVSECRSEAEFVGTVLERARSAGLPFGNPAYLRCYCWFCHRLGDSAESWAGGCDRDMLDAFPAQRLIRVIDEQCVAVGLREIVALKTDRVWLDAGEFGLPFAPFDLEGCWDIEDVDRAEAERLGLIGRRDYPEPPRFMISLPEFRNRISAAIHLRRFD